MLLLITFTRGVCVSVIIETRLGGVRARGKLCLSVHPSHSVTSRTHLAI